MFVLKILFIIGGVCMTKREFATKLYIELVQKQDVQEIVDSIKSEKCSLDEQLEIVNTIRQIHCEKTGGLFESVEAFLSLVNQVESQIKAQSNAESGDGNNANR